MKTFLGLILSFLSFVACAQEYGIKVLSTGIETKRGRHNLKMQVWNCTTRELEVPLFSLPWGGDSLGLVLYPASKIRSAPLKEQYPIADFPPVTIKIKPNGHVEGEAELEPRFGDLSRYDTNGGLLVFWSYDMSLITGGDPTFAAGVVPLGKTKLVVPSQKAGCPHVARRAGVAQRIPPSTTPRRVVTRPTRAGDGLPAIEAINASLHDTAARSRSRERGASQRAD